MNKIFSISKSKRFNEALDKTFKDLDKMTLKAILEIPSKNKAK